MYVRFTFIFVIFSLNRLILSLKTKASVSQIMAFIGQLMDFSGMHSTTFSKLKYVRLQQTVLFNDNKS